jgi:hypothetical protein
MSDHRLAVLAPAPQVDTPAVIDIQESHGQLLRLLTSFSFSSLSPSAALTGFVFV